MASGCELAENAYTHRSHNGFAAGRPTHMAAEARAEQTQIRRLRAVLPQHA